MFLYLAHALKAKRTKIAWHSIEITHLFQVLIYSITIRFTCTPNGLHLISMKFPCFVVDMDWQSWCLSDRLMKPNKEIYQTDPVLNPPPKDSCELTSNPIDTFKTCLSLSCRAETYTCILFGYQCSLAWVTCSGLWVIFCRSQGWQC